MATVLLVRHGETTWNRSGRVQGWAPTSLTDRGREQAATLGAHLASTVDVDRLVSSDLRRAAETARYVAREVGCDLTTDAAWRERDFGCLQGFSPTEVFEAYPEYALSVSGASAATVRPDSGEALVEVRERVLDRWERLRTDLEPDETVVVVAHGGPNRLLLGSILDYDVVDSVLDIDQDNCALNEIHTSDPRVVRQNDTRYLPEDLTVDSETVA
ncbi:histidine phosphatase family protein [Salinigranum sp.]|uniref:histidine phosphatase family protein n=1 Tax=Salinigranum sp. TaxID=1966351 RepID=UPI0035627069